MKSALAALALFGTLLLTAQTASTDLEIGARKVSYQDLLHLPQVSFASNDSNFTAPAHLSGVSLEELKRSFGAEGDMVVALCKDGYRSNYSVSYLAAHHPVLVLTVDGKPQKDWPRVEHGAELGPYVIANPNFVPSFKVLSHTDEAAIPFEVVKLEFRNEHQVFGAIAPRGEFAAGSPVMQGYQIAQQNCFRCHNSGEEGGQMAKIGWPVLAMVAKSSPDFLCQICTQSSGGEPQQQNGRQPWV